jgi:hypothetical protein
VLSPGRSVGYTRLSPFCPVCELLPATMVCIPLPQQGCEAAGGRGSPPPAAKLSVNP